MRPATRSGKRASQDAKEFGSFLDIVRSSGARSYLEIGARNGDTFFDVMRAMPLGSIGVAVDLPGGAWGKAGTDSDLQRAADELRGMGYRVTVILGDSGSQDVIGQVAEFGPYDIALIDGDHRYDGVKRDWLNYGHMSEIVAFHDIDGEGVVQRTSGDVVEVPRLWKELRDGYDHVELITPGAQMGIGVLWK